MDPRTLYVKRGDPVLPAFRKLVKELAGLRLIAGRGVLLTRTSTGTVVSVRAAVTGFTGAWDVQISGQEATIGRGYVNGKEPELKGVPISGTKEKGTPTLKLDVTNYDKSGRSWIAIKATVDETGKIVEPKDGKGDLGLTVVQTASLEDPDDSIGLHAIAMLKRRENETKELGRKVQIAFFDYQHLTSRQNAKWRHFFLPG